MTCWRRLRDWQQAGVWQKLHETLLSRWPGADRLDWSRAGVDSASVRAVGGGEKDRPQSYGPRQGGEHKHPVLTEANGTPLSAILTGANRHDATQLRPLVDAVPSLGGRRGRSRRRPQRLYADRAYGSRRHRQELRARHIAPALARRGANMAGGWECTAGWWSGPWAGCASSAGGGCATSAALTSMKPSCPWAARSSASDDYHLFVRGSY